MSAPVSGRPALFLVALMTIACDRVTKHLATSALAGMPTRSFLADTIRLSYVENTGGFLGLGSELPVVVRTAVFTGATGLMLIALVVLAVRRKWQGWSALGITLFVAGGTSNLVDRIARGSVVDFLNVGIGPLRTGVFNVADMAIMLGAVLFIVTERRRGKEANPTPDTDDPA